jgi:hypothetical protein
MQKKWIERRKSFFVSPSTSFIIKLERVFIDYVKVNVFSEVPTHKKNE